MPLKKASSALDNVKESVARDSVMSELDVDDSRESMIWSMATWAGVAMFMLALAILSARTEAGADRIAAISDGRAFRTASAVQAERVAVDPMVSYETRRLSDAIRVLGSERDQLASRLEVLERSVGDVTASIGKQAETAPRVIRPADPRGMISQPQPLAAEVNASSATDNALDTQVIKTEFAVDLVGDTSLEALRARWAQLRAQYGPLLEGLRPLVVVKEGTRAGIIELRLVAGPLSNANTAARLCVTLTSAGLECKPTVFDGQRLALR